MTIKVGEETYYSEEYVKKLQEENERLKELDENYPIEEQLEEALKYENIYKSRNEKATEYINKYLPNYDFDKSNLNELLNILQGVDKE